MIHSQTTERPDEKSTVLSHIAMAWNAESIDYGVAHGLENFPEFGRDLDVVVHRDHLARAIDIAVRILEEAGFKASVPRFPWYPTKAIFAARHDLLLQIDLLPSLSWAATNLVEKPNTRSRLGHFKVDPWAGIAKRILMNVLSGKEPKETSISRDESEFVAKQAQHLLGQQLGKDILGALEAGDKAYLLRLAPAIRKRVLITGLLHPLEFLQLAVLWLYKEVLPYVTGLAPIIALVGPDGVGKSTVIERLPAHIPEVFLGIDLRHWHPNLLPRLGELFRKPPGVTATADGLILPRRTPGRFQTLRLAYYWFDFFLGHFIKDRRDSSGLKWVLYDRCALDMAVDPVRYGLSSPRGTRLLWRLIPKPDLVILLHDDPERIHARKPELPVEEIARQNALWLQLAAEGEVDAILRVDAGPEEMAERVKELIIEKFIERGKQAPGGRRDDLGWLRSVLGGGERDG